MTNSQKIEEIYDFKFPNSLKIFLSEALPISLGFYNWRDFSDDNIGNIKNMMNYFFEYINHAPCDKYIPNDNYWVDKWEKMPKDLYERKKIVLEEYKKAPKIVPIYMHRFMLIIDDKNPPILSIHYTDVIYYRRDLSEYFMVEFCGLKIEKNINDYKYIPFWMDLMEVL